jgi:hypothetical protein
VQFLTSGFLVDGATVEGLAGFDDAHHALLNFFEVFGGEGLVDVEVIVEAILNVWADAEFCFRVQFLDGLCQHVRCGVTQDFQTFLVGDVDTFDGSALGDGAE